MSNKNRNFLRSRLLRRGPWLLVSLVALVVLACGGAATVANPTPISAPLSVVPADTQAPAAQSGSDPLPDSGTNTPRADTPDRPNPGGQAGASTDDSQATVETPTEQFPSIPPEVPMVDKSIHSVPLEDIVFGLASKLSFRGAGRRGIWGEARPNEPVPTTPDPSFYSG